MQATVRIKGYDGIEQLGLGKRAVAFKARSRKHKIPVVIKVLLPHLAGDRRFVARFKRDVVEAAKIRHENLVNILEYGRSETSHFVVMEYFDGIALEEVLAEHPRVPTPIALSIMLNLSKALEAIHARDLVHRDVRPANVVITHDGEVKLANVSLATDIGENGRVTHAGKVTATPAYMSPEQTRGEELTPRSDIFSLGSVGFELLGGRRAFGRGDFGDIVDRIQSSGLPSLRTINPVVEGPIERILETAMQKDLSERCEHVSELLMDLEEGIEKYGYVSDRGAMAAYIADPAGYTEQYTEAVLEELTARAPIRDSAKPGNAASLLRYYEKVCFLDPNDEGAKRELERLRRERGVVGATKRAPTSNSPATRYASLDPDAEYRVVLESFDPSQENEASFALKLSMKLRTPLPRIKSLVRSAPSRVTDRLGYKRAIQLARAIESVGGRVRLDVCPSSGTAGPSASVTDSGAEPSKRKDGHTCSACGWVEEAGTEFCSMCLEAFAPSKKLDARTLREKSDIEENPLVEEPAMRPSALRFLDQLAELPTNVKVVGAAVVVVVVALLLTR